MGSYGPVPPLRRSDCPAPRPNAGDARRWRPLHCGPAGQGSASAGMAGRRRSAAVGRRKRRACTVRQDRRHAGAEHRQADQEITARARQALQDRQMTVFVYVNTRKHRSATPIMSRCSRMWMPRKSRGNPRCWMNIDPPARRPRANTEGRKAYQGREGRSGRFSSEPQGLAGRGVVPVAPRLLKVPLKGRTLSEFAVGWAEGSGIELSRRRAYWSRKPRKGAGETSNKTTVQYGPRFDTPLQITEQNQ